LRFEVLTAVKVSVIVFWVVMPCGLVYDYECSGGIYSLYLHFNPEDGGDMFLQDVGNHL
jgi:hypothetical protein